MGRQNKIAPIFKPDAINKEPQQTIHAPNREVHARKIVDNRNVGKNPTLDRKMDSVHLGYPVRTQFIPNQQKRRFIPLAAPKSRERLWWQPVNLNYQQPNKFHTRVQPRTYQRFGNINPYTRERMSENLQVPQRIGNNHLFAQKKVHPSLPEGQDQYQQNHHLFQSTPIRTYPLQTPANKNFYDFSYNNPARYPQVRQEGVLSYPLNKRKLNLNSVNAIRLQQPFLPSIKLENHKEQVINTVFPNDTSNHPYEVHVFNLEPKTNTSTDSQLKTKLNSLEDTKRN